MYDYLIVGSGLFGAIFAHEAMKKGKTCLVLEKRDQIGGNIYTEEVEGIQVHRYGAHIFHTSNKEVWDYIQQFAEFNRYTNSPIARYKDELYNLPFNMNTFSKMWGIATPAEAKAKIEEQVKEAGITEPKNLEEQALSLVGRDIYEKLVKGYTEKQWGRRATELPSFIIKRLPVRLTYDNNYFNDKYQGIPVGGYTQIIEKRSEALYRAIHQKTKSLPTSNLAVRANLLKTRTIELTPQESEQLSKFVSDETYVKQQKEDIEELSAMFKKMLREDEEEKTEEEINSQWVESTVARKLLGVSQKTWQTYRDERRIPFSQFGRKIYVKRADLETFMESHYITARK